jgi:hypothetical protein
MVVINMGLPRYPDLVYPFSWSRKEISHMMESALDHDVLGACLWIQDREQNQRSSIQPPPQTALGRKGTPCRQGSIVHKNTAASRQRQGELKGALI